MMQLLFDNKLLWPLRAKGEQQADLSVWPAAAGEKTGQREFLFYHLGNLLLSLFPFHFVSSSIKWLGDDAFC